MFIDAEDYELWLRISKIFKLYNLDEFLLLYRINPLSITSLKREQQLCNSYKAFREFYECHNISYDEFCSFLFVTSKTNPFRRMQSISKVLIKSRSDLPEYIYDNLKYFKFWLKSHILTASIKK